MIEARTWLGASNDAHQKLEKRQQTVMPIITIIKPRWEPAGHRLHTIEMMWEPSKQRSPVWVT
jgi:hypothetical protein